MILLSKSIHYFKHSLVFCKSCNYSKTSVFLRNRCIQKRFSMAADITPDIKKKLIAVCQMTSTEDKQTNFSSAQRMILGAASQGCQMVFLPECFDMICDSRKKTMANTEPIDGPLIAKYRDLAKQCKVWLSLGGLHEKNVDPSVEKANNAHIVIDCEGNVVSVYRKVHLFNLDIPGVVRLVESEFSLAGNSLQTPVSTPIGKVGLGICYDIRFAEFAISLAKAGADIITYPSSFTVPTGLAHWESLLRARAIETQCYVVAAAQTGTHNPKRSSYGHAMVVDPWGVIIAQCGLEPGYVIAEIDLNYLTSVRQKLPVWSDRKPDLYGYILAANDANANNLDCNEAFKFGASAIVSSSQIFLKTQHSIAFVNHRPVLDGHVLVSTIRDAKRLNELNRDEISDLFTTVQKVQNAVEMEYKASASTIAIQDGPEAGQSITQVHVHILPRKSTDFGGNIDQLYSELQKHDKIEYQNKYKLRTEQEMADEASKLKLHFK